MKQSQKVPHLESFSEMKPEFDSDFHSDFHPDFEPILFFYQILDRVWTGHKKPLTF